ncbi:MAG: histidine kinase [Deltaproteobacteria bacterium]|jgi:hypothetical protein|nr:histidine kinase [Deltaproteobacteria bacterium]
MAASFTSRARIAYYLAWVPMVALLGALLGARGGMTWYAAIAAAVALGLPYALVCGSTYYMARALPLRRASLVRGVLNLLSASLLAAGVWAAVGNVAGRLLGGATGETLVERTPLVFGTGVAFFLLSLAFHYLVLALEDIRRAERDADEARVLGREAELRALRAQIDPHFLFNSLNSIAALTTVDPPRAREMCQLLSEFFRATLRSGDQRTLPLGEELDLVRRYLEIERVRFADRMTVDEDVDLASLERVELPPLLLQPLVENAVKHGVTGLDEGGRVSFSVAGAPARVVLAVENRFDPAWARQRRRPGQGRGLAIVRERLEAFYGADATMVVRKGEGTFRVELTLPDGAPQEPDEQR